MAGDQILGFFKDNPEVVGSILKTVPAIVGLNQAAKSKKAIYGEGGYLEKLENIENNRQQLVNPYASLENPFENLAVATQAAEMQAEQSDIALANTLGISADIEKQEVTNQRLRAQGQSQVDMAKAQGQAGVMAMQERRENQQLDRLQGLIDLEQERRAAGFASGMTSLSSSLGGLSKSLIKPEGSGSDDSGGDDSGGDDTE
jgi:seryl-tRNA synthetase